MNESRPVATASQTTAIPASESVDADPTSPLTRLDKRDVKALTEVMTVLDDQGRGKDVDGLYEVFTQSGGTYLVDAHEHTCECPDAECRNPTGGCKHVRRVAFATGARAIPAWANADAIDDDLGAFVSGSPRFEDESTGEADEGENASPIEAHTPDPDCRETTAVADGGQLLDDDNAGSSESDEQDEDCEPDRGDPATTEDPNPDRHYERVIERRAEKAQEADQ